MKITIAWWDLSNSTQTIDSLQAYLKEEGSIRPWGDVIGLRVKCWISNAEENLWGAVMVWENSPASKDSLPPNRPLKLIGYPPNFYKTFDVGACVEGEFEYLSFNQFGSIST